jgi:hypothetical protein
MLCQGNGQGDFVEIVVGLANKGEQESTLWLRFAPLGGSARHFCALDRAANSKARAPGASILLLCSCFQPEKSGAFPRRLVK